MEAYTVTIDGHDWRGVTHSGAMAAWLAVQALPERPSTGTAVLVRRDEPDPHAWLLRVVVNRTQAGREYIQFRDPAAERRERAFRAWWRARQALVLHSEGDGVG